MFDRSRWQREYRRKNANASTKRYERENPKGFLMRVYRNMESRVRGTQKREAQYYVGLSLLPRPAFYEWALASAKFWELWQDWQQTGRQQGWTPSIHRLDATQGYTLDNMAWITHSENSADLRSERRYRPIKRS